MLALSGALVLTSCGTLGRPELVDAETSARLKMCSKMAAPLKRSLKVGGYAELPGGGGVGGILQFGAPQIAPEHVSSVNAMFLECNLWARREPGHDTKFFSKVILQLGGVYAASSDPSEIESRLELLNKAMEEFASRLSAQDATIAKLTPEQREALREVAQRIANDPQAMAQHLETVMAQSLSVSSRTTKLEIVQVYSQSERESEELSRVSAAIGTSEMEIARLRARIEFLERPAPSPRSYREVAIFDEGSAEIKGPARERILLFAKRHSNSDVRVVGFADTRGSVRRNVRLSQSRAEAVAIILLNAGLRVVEVVGVGPTSLFAGGLASNRRAIVEVVESSPQ